MNVVSWLDEVKCYLDLTCAPVEQIVRMATTYLTGPARDSWVHTKPELLARGLDVNNWVVFEDAMRQQFVAHDLEQEARLKLRRLKQIGSVEAFVREVRKYISRLVSLPMSQGDKIATFLDGLQVDLQSALMVNPRTARSWDDFEELVRYATSLDVSRRGLLAGKQSNKVARDADPSKTGDKRRTGGQGPPAKKPKPPGSVSGKYASLGISKELKDQRMANGECLKCGHKGHLAVDCKNPTKPK